MLKILAVLAVQAPYTSARLQKLAELDALQVDLFLENESYREHTNWKPEPIPGVRVRTLQSFLVRWTETIKDMGYRDSNHRPLPFRLPLLVVAERPSVLWLCNATQIAFVIALRPLLRFRIALTVEDTLHASRGKSRLSMLFKKWAYKKADLYLPFSDQSVEFLQHFGINEKIERTSWSLDLKAFNRQQTERKHERMILGLDDKLVFLFVGRIIALKGILPLLRAWSRLTNDSQATLLIAGKGPLEAECKEFVSANNLTNVRFIGYLDSAQIKKAYWASDVVVLPTTQDLFSLTVVEAMAAGCPVITTPYNGAVELVEEGVTGWVCDPRNEGSIVSAIEGAINAQARLPEMGNAARLRVEPFDNDTVIPRLAGAFKKLSKRREYSA